MAGKKQLPPVRLATLDDAVPQKSLSESIESGTRLDELKAQRRILVAHIESENALTRDIPPLMRQMREISKEIESLELQEQERVAEPSVEGSSSDAEWKLEAI